MLVLKKRKAIKLPTVQAEMLRAAPEPIALPSATPSADITPLAARAIVSEQLPSPKVQVQPSEDTIPSERVPAPSLAPTTIGTQFQLPKATLSKTQRLGLLQERFLRGEVTEETYNKLRAEIESHTGEDITKDELEVHSTEISQQQPKSIEESKELETSTTSTPELVGKPPSPETPEVEVPQPQVPESQTSAQVQEPELIVKKQTDEE